jgi:hypothetical protein
MFQSHALAVSIFKGVFPQKTFEEEIQFCILLTQILDDEFIESSIVVNNDISDSILDITIHLLAKTIVPLEYIEPLYGVH